MKQLSATKSKLELLKRDNLQKYKQIMSVQNKLEGLYSGMHMADAVQKVVLSRYTINHSRFLIVKEVTEIIIKDITFLGGHCRNFISPCSKGKTSNVNKSNEKDKVLSLPELIELEYLKGKFKPNTHNVTKTTHIFN